MFCCVSFHLLWFDTARCGPWTLLDKQYDWFCFSIHLAGQLSYSIILILSALELFICLEDICLIIVNLQYIREYTNKVDELMKDKIEARNEIKTKESEEKDIVAQQVYFVYFTNS